ncbi:MAG: hypothetical protein OCC49_15545 [Fibrobacterales bacterium]
MMKLTELLFKKDGVHKTIENVISTGELLEEIIKIKQARTTTIEIAEKKLFETQRKLRDSIDKEKSQQLQCEDQSLIFLKNDEKKKAFALLRTSMKHEKQSITLLGQLQKVTQNIADIGIDIQALKDEVYELHNAQNLLQKEKQSTITVPDLTSAIENYKSPFTSTTARKIDELIHQLELSFSQEHHSIETQLHYDEVEAYIESIRAKIS